MNDNKTPDTMTLSEALAYEAPQAEVRGGVCAPRWLSGASKTCHEATGDPGATMYMCVHCRCLFVPDDPEETCD